MRAYVLRAGGQFLLTAASARDYARHGDRLDDGEEEWVRAVALDVHRDFCEVAVVAEGQLRSAGRIQTRPEALELFAQSLDAGDWVALEVTGNAWAIARILERHVARVIVVSPSDTGIRMRSRSRTAGIDR
jgi:transposase